MKVIYETIEKAIRKVADDALRHNRIIERIELTPREYAELQEVVGKYYMPPALSTYMGIPIVKGTF